MAIRIIRQEGDEILRKKSKDVEVIDEKIHELIQDMIETVHRYNGVGLAAVQIGVLKRIIVIDLGEEDTEPFVIINPQIIKQKGTQTVEEGCLSFPNKYAKIVRPEQIKIKALNEKGESFVLEGKELLAQAIAHEIDHLNGEVFMDKIIPGTLEIIRPETEDK